MKNNSEYMHLYYVANKTYFTEKLLCECGIEVKRCSMNYHKKTDKHALALLSKQQLYKQSTSIYNSLVYNVEHMTEDDRTKLRKIIDAFTKI